MKRFVLIWIICILTLVSCFSPWQQNEGTITINLGSGNSRSAWPHDEYGFLDKIEYNITITGQGKTIEPEIINNKISAVVSAGTYTINVEAYLDNIETPITPSGERLHYATGSASVTVAAGENKAVQVIMERVINDIAVYKITADELVRALSGGSFDLADLLIEFSGFFAGQNPTWRELSLLFSDEVYECLEDMPLVPKDIFEDRLLVRKDPELKQRFNPADIIFAETLIYSNFPFWTLEWDDYGSKIGELHGLVDFTDIPAGAKVFIHVYGQSNNDSFWSNDYEIYIINNGPYSFLIPLYQNNFVNWNNDSYINPYRIWECTFYLYAEIDGNRLSTNAPGSRQINLTGFSADDMFSVDIGRLPNIIFSSITLTYNGNGSTGGAVPTDYGSPYQVGAPVWVLGNTGYLTKSGYVFSGWNTAPDGSGTAYIEGDFFYIHESMILYAQWREPQGPSPLPKDQWVEGDLTFETEQWFAFTPPTIINYIHLNYTGLARAYIQVFTDNYIAVGNKERLYTWTGDLMPESAGSIKRELIPGNEYLICIQQTDNGMYAQGTYRIAFTESGESPSLITIPTAGVVPLTMNTWSDGETSQTNGQWYSFAATAGLQYVHILLGSAISSSIQIYGINGGSMGDAVYSPGTRAAGPWELEVGNIYYIRVPDYYWGTFKIAFNASQTPPAVILPGNITLLTADTWENGTVPGGEWYRFTATEATQYVHFNFTTATAASVNIYDSNRNMLGSSINVTVTEPYFSRTFTVGSIYYLYIYHSMYAGDFQIAFNSSEAPPIITLSSSGVTVIAANTWVAGSNDSRSKQWFSFTANANPQYIHIRGLSIAISLRLYDSSGNAIGNPIRANADNSYLSQPVTIGQVYYIKVEGVGYTENNYRISFNNSAVPLQ